jgi:hypothetical protein
MGKLIFKIHGIEFEYIGEPLEIERFIQRLVAGAIQLSPSQTRLTPETDKLLTSHPQVTFSETSKLKRSLPSDKEVKKYIMSKPMFKHTLFDIQEFFFGTKFKSRGETKTMYHKTARQVRGIRKEIEREYGGEFKEAFAEGGIKEFVFKKNPDATA